MRLKCGDKAIVPFYNTEPHYEWLNDRSMCGMGTREVQAPQEIAAAWAECDTNRTKEEKFAPSLDASIFLDRGITCSGAGPES